MTENEMLKYAIDSGIVDISTIYQEIEMKEKKKYLSLHKEKIWQASDGRWKTHLPNDKRTLVNKKTREELEDRLVEYYKEQEELPYMDKVFSEWLESKSNHKEIQRQTVERYKQDYCKYIKDSSITKIKFCEITEDMIQEYIQEIIAEFDMTAKAWSNVRIIIRGIFIFAKRKKYTNISITNALGDLQLSKRAFKTRIMKDEEQIFTDDEVDLLVKRGYTSKRIQELAVVLALQTGMRAGEISALEWTDVFENYISVSKTEIRTRDENNKQIYVIRDTPKTENSIRKVYFTKETKETINLLRELTGDKKFVFYHKGRQLHAKIISYTCTSMCVKVGIKPRSVHKCRKTYATNLINADVDEKLIQLQLGHSDIITTKKYYYYNNRNEKEILEQLEKALGK